MIGSFPLKAGCKEVSAGLAGAVIKAPTLERVVWLEYLETVAKERDGWKDLYRACREVVKQWTMLLSLLSFAR